MGNGVAPHIVGGSEAKPHQFPWQVGIFMDGSYFCGGSIICKLAISINSINFEFLLPKQST